MNTGDQNIGFGTPSSVTVAAVPEPGVGLLAGTAALGLIRRRRRSACSA